MAEVVNKAVEANLRKVLAAEQYTSAVRLGWVRLAVVVLAFVIVWWPGQKNEELIWPTRLSALLLIGLSSLTLWITAKTKRLGRWAALSVPFLDVPALGITQYLQMPLLPMPWMVIASNVAIMSALTALSVLSLSRPIIVMTAITATGFIWLVSGNAGLPLHPMMLTTLMMVGIALVGVAVVAQLRRLLHQARAKDLVGKYILGDRLGAGGMAEVFSATYSPEGGFERRVAVKRILPSFANSAESVALFRREAELGALLAHPNVVQVLDFGTDGTGYFIAMEYVDGVSLAKLLACCRESKEPVALPIAVHLLWMISEALDYMHTRTAPTGAVLNLVHRDVNPPNVMLSRIGEVKLGDFGIARAGAHERLTAEGVVRGKMGYSAPEQLLGKPYDARADLFSLGVTLHEVLCLKRPFAGDSDVSLFRACIEDPIQRPSAVRPDLPAELDNLVMALVERDLTKRTQSAHDVIERLRMLPSELNDHGLGKRLLAELVVRVMAAVPAERSSRNVDPTADTIDMSPGRRATPRNS